MEGTRVQSLKIDHFKVGQFSSLGKDGQGSMSPPKAGKMKKFS